MQICGARYGIPVAISAPLLFLALSPLFAQAPDPSFILEARNPQPYSPAYLGNGAIGLVTSPLAIEPSRSFLASVYDHSDGDVPRIAAAPDWNEFAVSNGSAWLGAATPLPSIGEYSQRLDMFDGLLRTSYVWNAGDKSVRVQVEQFVSRDTPYLACARLTIQPQFPGMVRVRLPLRNWPAPRRYPLEQLKTLDGEAKTNPWAIWYPGRLNITGAQAQRSSNGALLSLSAVSPGTGIHIGQAVALQWTGPAHCELHHDALSAEAELTFTAQTGQSYTVTKFAAFSTAKSGDNAQTAISFAEAARKAGWDHSLHTSAEAWHRVWDADILVEGDPTLQRTIHSMLFYLLGSVREHLDISTPPMGLSSAGYYGHIFWDADTFMFPTLLVLHPELAKPMVAFRSRTLGVARQNATRNGYRGAMYPWEAGPDGAESTPRFAFQNASSENHVNGDVAVASWQYWAATADSAWLKNDCWPILRDTANFWASRVTFDPKLNRYVIGNVVAVNESDIGVSNDPYTNAVAKRNLELAIETAAILKVQANPKWRDVADKLVLPDSDSALLWFPLGRAFPPDQTRRAINAMLKRVTDGHSGAMMGTEFYPILAAQIGDRPGNPQITRCAEYSLSAAALASNRRDPAQPESQLHHRAGAFLQQFIFGYTGLRLTANGLEKSFPPALPPGITRLTLKNVTVHGKRQTLSFASAQ